MLFPILLASVLEALVSFSGALLIIFSEEKMRKMAHYVISFAIGALLGVALLEIIPETLESASHETIFFFVLGGILLFFIVEKFLSWFHRHEGRESGQRAANFTYLILWGDFLHNFIDGIIIALSFLTSPTLGVATTIAVILHEIPQEIADFAVLLHGGLSTRKALLYNFLISLSTVAGALLVYFFGSIFEPFLPYLLALIAGNFIYIASTDLMPELHENTNIAHTIGQILLIVLGATLVILPGFFLEVH